MSESVLALRDFRLTLLIRFFDGLALQMLTVAAGWQLYQLTRDPLLLGLIGLAEAIPYIAAALWAGELVDRREKSGIIAAAEWGQLLSGAGLALAAALERPPLLPIYLLIAWSGLARCFQWVAMTAYLQTAVPSHLFPKAAAWSTSVWHAAAILGPALGGLIYGARGAASAYAAVAACFLLAALASSRLSTMPGVSAAAGSAMERIASGLRFVFSEQVILAAMSLDMFGVLFGGVDGVLPIFAERLGAGPEGLGLLKAAPALGALCCSLVLTRHQPFKRLGAAFMTAVAVFGLCMILFALSESFWLSAFILWISGAVDGVGMVIRASIYQALTPEALRGRVASVNGIFIRSSNQIGAFESGVAAKWMGLVPSVVFGGCVTLASVAVTFWKAPKLWHFQNSLENS